MGAPSQTRCPGTVSLMTIAKKNPGWGARGVAKTILLMKSAGVLEEV